MCKTGGHNAQGKDEAGKGSAKERQSCVRGASAKNRETDEDGQPGKGDETENYFENGPDA